MSATTAGIRQTDRTKIVQALAPVTPSSASPRWISLKNVKSVRVVISCANATTVTGAAIGLAQATAVAGTGTKTLAFDRAVRNLDTAAGDTDTAFAVVSNTFTTDATNSKNLLYQIDVNPEDLDISNGFRAFRVTVGNATATVIDVTYELQMYYGGNVAKMASVIVD